MSAFAILSLPATFALTEEQVEGRELELTKRLHPDRWQRTNPSLHRKALIAQVAVNEALEAIREPIARGETLLSLQASDLCTELQEGHRPDPNFLLEQLELQEEVRGNITAPRKRELKKRIRKELATLIEALEASFSTIETSSDQSTLRPAVSEALRLLGEARYWRNLQQALRGEAPR